MTITITTPPETRSSRRTALIAGATVAMMALTIALPRAEAQVIPPSVPANLEVPIGNTPFLAGHAYGTQNFMCLLTGGSVMPTLASVCREDDVTRAVPRACRLTVC